MTPENLRSLWVGSGQWDGIFFQKYFGELRGNDLAAKFCHYQYDVLKFFIKECNDDEIEKLLNFCVK